MNMLIIGNGFDLAHKRPTTYSDFLQFLYYILSAKEYIGDKAEFKSRLMIDCPTVRDYILSSFDTRKNPRSNSVGNTNNAVQEIYNCLDKNVWYNYFSAIWRKDFIRGKNWIDFEGEIREIIEFFDHHIDDIYGGLPLNLPSECPDKVKLFRRQLDFSDYYSQNQRVEPSIITYSDFIDKSYQDLDKLIRCLEIYLDDCVGKMSISCYSPDIQGLEFDSVLSFNYTTIPTDIYPSLTNTHNIHGHAKASRPAAENDMVLGVNEYWEGNDKNTRTNFNLYKKFVQRIIKDTGIGYKKTLKVMLSEYRDSEHLRTKTKGYTGARHNNVYIFGHSLDVTDGDILREVIQTEGVVTTIFYRNKQQQANQIANLSKVLTQDELLERTLSTSPTIIFKQQADMKKL